jgi:hypothetical protein
VEVREGGEGEEKAGEGEESTERWSTRQALHASLPVVQSGGRGRQPAQESKRTRADSGPRNVLSSVWLAMSAHWRRLLPVFHPSIV